MKFHLTGLLMILGATAPLGAAAPDPLVWEKLRQWVPSLDGSGVEAAQVEAGDPMWQVNPVAVGQPESLFTWQAADGSTNQYPNQLGNESPHANEVGKAFYSPTNGAAPGLLKVDNYEAVHFVSLINALSALNADIVNQSFAFGSQMNSVDLNYDEFAEHYGTLFISGLGNTGPPQSPATAYNGIAVGAWEGSSSIGPTSDGRSKPDITAKASLTSFSTPKVSGTAALLQQAAAERWTGPDLTAATDYRTLKALILNGADKPFNWTNGPTAPLDARHGTGVLNPLRSYHQLRAGRQNSLTASTYSANAPHPPPSPTGFLPTRRGWNHSTISSSVNSAQGHHYYLDITTNGTASEPFTLNATLIWSRQETQTSINNLDLFLFRVDDGALIASSESPVNNVEYIHFTELGPARYVLQVYKTGGRTGRVTNNETYALAFDIGPQAAVTLQGLIPNSPPFTGRLTGEPYEQYIVEFSTDFQSWTPFLTNSTPSSGWFEFSDPASTGSGHRFYRSLLAP